MIDNLQKILYYLISTNLELQNALLMDFFIILSETKQKF